LTLNEFSQSRARNEDSWVNVEREPGEPGLVRQVYGRNPFIYSAGDQCFGALLRGGGYMLAIHGRARFVRQVQGMEYERGRFIYSVVGPVAVENFRPGEATGTPADQIADGALRFWGTPCGSGALLAPTRGTSVG
jgi:hypothetical protein